LVWVSGDNLWVCYVGSISLILGLYAVKAVTLRFLRGAAAGMAFLVAIALCVPVTWALSPDWDNKHLLRIGIYVGSPIATLTVPCASCLFDSARGSRSQFDVWLWRLPLELFLGVPAWLFFWVYFELLVLGWIWI